MHSNEDVDLFLIKSIYSLAKYIQFFGTAFQGLCKMFYGFFCVYKFKIKTPTIEFFE